MVKLAVFDWNGTLLADNTAILAGTNAELSVLGAKPIKFTYYQKHQESPVTKFYKNLGINLGKFVANPEAVTRSFHEIYEPLAAKASTRPGARQLLKKLNQEGVNCIILSNHTMEGIYFQLERLKLGSYFSAVLANEDIVTSYHAGKLERLKNYLANNDYSPSEVVIIGDTVEEVAIGRELGLHTISISGGYNSLGRLKQAKPDILISKLPDIVDKIKEL